MSQPKEALGRRNFLKHAATSAGMVAFPAIVPGAALGLKGSTAPSDRIHMGSIGVGSMGGGHLRGLLETARVHYEKHPEEAEELAGGQQGEGNVPVELAAWVATSPPV